MNPNRADITVAVIISVSIVLAAAVHPLLGLLALFMLAT